MEIKKLDEFLNESYVFLPEKISLISKVFKEKELIKAFTNEEIDHIYDYIVDVLKKKDLYEDGEGLKK